MTLEQIELEYVSRYGPVDNHTLREEVASLAAAGKINRIRHGWYEP
jgi:hypothetical protein